MPDDLYSGPVGAVLRQKLLDGGASAPDVAAWEQNLTKQMLEGGAHPAKVQDYWGTTDPDMSGFQKKAKAALDEAMAPTGEGTAPPPTEHIANNPWEMFSAGLQMSVSSLPFGKPNTIMPQDANLMSKILHGAGMFVGDIPATVAGFVGGAAAGAAAGPIASVAGGGAGAAALPAAIRTTLMDHYASKEGPFTWSDFWTRASNVIMETGKAAIVGGVAGPAGAVAGGAAGVVAGRAVATGANLGTQAATAAIIGSGLEGHVPDADDFIVGGALALGMHAGGKVYGATQRYVPSPQTTLVAESLRDTYAETGLPPADVAKKSMGDPVLQGEIIAPTAADGTRVTPTLDAMKPPEPKPYKEKEGEAEPPVAPEKVQAEVEQREDTALTIQGDDGKWQPPPEEKSQEPPPEHPWSKIDVGQPPSDPTDMEKTWYYAPEGPGGDRLRWSESRQEYVSYQDMTSEDKEFLNSLVEPKVGQTGDEMTYWWRGTKHEPEGFDPNDTTRSVKAVWVASSRETAEIFAEGKHHVSRVAIQPGKYFDFRDPSQMGELRARARELGLFNHEIDKIQTGYWGDIEGNPRFQDFLKAEGYEGYFEREASDLPVNLAVFNKDKIHLLGVSKEDAQAVARRGEQPTDQSPPRPPRQNFSKPGTLAYVYEQGKRPEEAKQPLTLTEGGGGKQPPGPPGKPMLPGPRKPDPFAPNADMLADRILDIVAEPGKESRLPDWLNPRKLIAQFQSQLTPAREVDKRFKLDEGQIGVEDMLRQTYASKERAGYFVRWGGLDPITFKQTDAPSWMQAFEAVKEDGGTAKGFMAYRLAKRAVEKAGQGVETGVKLQEAVDFLASKGIEEKYERGAGLMRLAKDAPIDYAIGSGLFSEVRGAAMKELNREHIVMRRVIDPDYSPPRPGRTFGVREPVKKMEGSDRQIVDPATAEIDNLHTIIAMADRNRAIGHVIGLIERQNDYATRDGLDKYLELRRVDRELGLDTETGKVAEAELYDANGNLIPPRALPAVEGLLGMRAHSKGLGANEFLYYREGKPEIWHVDDPNLAEVLRVAWQGQANPVANLFSKFAGIQRAGITSSPSFPFRAILHGQLASAVSSPHGSVLPFHDFAKGFWEVMGQGEKYKEWIANGGAGTAISDLDRDYLAKDIERVFKETGTENSLWNVMKHPIDAMRTMQHMVDAASRVGYMKRAENAGLSPLRAATESRVAYLDHGEPMAASWVNTWARMVPFMPIGFKDIEQTFRAMQDRPVSFMLKGAAVLSTPTILNYVVNKIMDENLPVEERYDALPQWERDLYWVLPPVNGVRLKIKSPYVMGYMFKTLPERFLDFFYAQDPRAFREWGQSMIAQYVPPFIPSLATPILEQAMNKNFLSQRPLIKSSLEGVTNWMQYTPETSATARGIARWLGPPGLNLVNASPIVIENYARDWGGTLPTELLKLIEGPFKAPAHPWEMADSAFLGAFFARSPAGGAQPIQDFYSAVEELKTAHNSFRLALNHADMSEITTTLDQRAVVSLSTITKAIHSHSIVIQAIAADENMTTDEKRQRTDQLASAMIQMSKAGLQITDMLK